MLESSWSDPQSDLTEEPGLASAGDSKPAVILPSFCIDFANDAAPRQRCVIPKVQPSQLNRSDQRVPVYWDQTVPVWQAGGASTPKRKSPGSHGRGQGRSSRRLEGGGASSSDTTSLENCCWCSSGRDDGNRRNDSTGPADGASPEVSFDAILSMYESSLVEKSFKWSRRDWWVLGALLKRRSKKPRHDERRRLWPRSFAGRCKFSGISVLSAAGALKRLGEVDHEESVRSLRMAIHERTSICDPSATCNSHCGIRLLNADATFQGRSCDFQNQLRNRRDSLSFSTPMLTTSSS